MNKSQELRNQRDILMQKSNDHSKAIVEKSKLIGAGDTSELITATLSKLKILDRKGEESGFMTTVRSFFGKGVEKIEERVIKAAAEGSSISEVTQNLMSIITHKRETIEGIVESLFDLKDDMQLTYDNTCYILEETLKELDEGHYKKAEEFNIKTLYQELLEYKTIMKENIKAADNTIQATQVTVHQIVALQPKLKAQLDDGLSILLVLNELKELNQACEDLENLSNKIRTDNIEKAYEAQMDALDRQIKTPEDLKILEDNAKRSFELQQKIQDKMKEVYQGIDEKITLLEDIDKQTGIETKATSLTVTNNKAVYGRLR